MRRTVNRSLTKPGAKGPRYLNESPLKGLAKARPNVVRRVPARGPPRPPSSRFGRKARSPEGDDHFDNSGDTRRTIKCSAALRFGMVATTSVAGRRPSLRGRTPLRNDTSHTGVEHYARGWRRGHVPFGRTNEERQSWCAVSGLHLVQRARPPEGEGGAERHGHTPWCMAMGLPCRPEEKVRAT